VRIIDARNQRALNRLLAPPSRDDRAFERRVRTIVDGVRTGGDRALVGYARRFDRVAPPLEISGASLAGRYGSLFGWGRPRVHPLRHEKSITLDIELGERQEVHPRNMAMRI